MAELSRFYGIIVSIYSELFSRHNIPHVHVRYAEHTAVISLIDGTVLQGSLPTKAQKLFDAWYLIHQEELLKCWDNISKGENPGKIEPLT